jgi:uncharacterized protein YggT (Ycf19 family)
MLILKDWIFFCLFYAIEAYKWTLIVYIIAGWLVQNRYAGWYVFLSELCEPALAFTRRITGNRLRIEHFDLSPIVLFFGLQLFQILLGFLFQPGG